MVRLLYNEILLRTPDTEGLNVYSEKLTHTSISEIALELKNSQEYKDLYS